MAHADSSLPSATSASLGISNTLVSSDSLWLIDSRATDHMASTPQLFSTYSPFRTPLLVSLADGSKVPAIGKGNVVINPILFLQGVLLVPSFL